MRRKKPPPIFRPPVAYHLTLHTGGDRPLFRRPGLAWAIVAALAARRRTAAACLLPHRLEWLLLGGGAPDRLVAEFKRLSTGLAWRQGCPGALWAGDDLVRPLRSRSSLRGVLAWVEELPWTAAVAAPAEEYPYRVRRASRPASTSTPRRVTAGSTAV